MKEKPAKSRALPFEKKGLPSANEDTIGKYALYDRDFTKKK